VEASPVEAWEVEGRRLWVKRDDLNCASMGGNKARALQFLLGDVHGGTDVVTVGGAGSTHVLATATHASSIGLRTRAYCWPHHMNPVAHRVRAAITSRCLAAPVLPMPPLAMLAAGWRRVTRGDHWIPFGGTSPLGMLGHVEGAVELADQVEMGVLPAPSQVYVALGTGGTAAGLATGFALAGLQTTVVAVRCGPSLAHERWWLRRLVNGVVGAAGLPASLAAQASAHLVVTHGSYSGAYGRPHPAASVLSATVAAARGVLLDDTYSAKACYAAARALPESRGPVLFWHTFDARWMT
jgi:D-cysteine desulfhydrase